MRRITLPLVIYGDGPENKEIRYKEYKEKLREGKDEGNNGRA